MIAWLQGTIIDKSQPGKLVLNVQGVGYDVETSLQTFFQVETEQHLVSLHIQTIVREDAFLLYGFFHKEERSLFRALIKVSGIGPKLAITILSSVSPAEFVAMVLQENAIALTRIPGIGKKTAERLLIEMKDSLKQMNLTLESKALHKTVGAAEEAIQALVSLGYSYPDSKKMVTLCDDNQKTCEQLIRQSLQLFSKV